MPTLLRLVELLGPECVTVVVAPMGLDVPLAGALLHDPRDSAAPTPGALLLGIGLAADATTFARLVQGGPAAVALKHEGKIDEDVLAAAVAAGVAVLTVPAGASWMRIAELAQALVSDDSSTHLKPPPRTNESSELVQELFDVANAVAARVHAPITIEDTQSRLLAYSAQDDSADAARAATILGHRVPDSYRAEVRRLGIAKRLLTEAAPIFFAPQLPNVSPRMVIALRARGQLLGSMWAITDEAFDEARVAAFADAARSVSLRIWQHRIAADLHREQRTQTMALVLAGGPTAVEVGRRIGTEAAGYRLLAATLQEGAAQRRDHLDRVRDALSAQASVTHPAALTAGLADVVYAVLPCSALEAESSEAARDTSARLRAALDGDLRGHVLVARSGHVSSLAEMAQARDEVHAVLRVLSTDSVRRHDAEIDDVGLQVVLHRLMDLQAGRPLLRNAALEAISAHDARHGTEYLQTLEAHLSSFGDAATAAAMLHVHTNTFRYRLRRLGEIFEVDLDDPDVRFSLMLQFRLARP